MITIRHFSTLWQRHTRAISRQWRPSAVQVLALCGLVGLAGAAASRQPSAASLPSPTVAQRRAADLSLPPLPEHALDAADLSAWLDGMIPSALEQSEVAGAVVSVVKDGKVLFAKGYGYADVATKRPMIAERTLVRPGSVSKLFTWTAVMQQVELGHIDLNADVNRYLDFKVPAFHGKPVTVADLMTHRTGFEEGLKDVLVTDPAKLQLLGDSLKAHVRPVLFEPGTVPAYSNYGAALAGYIVERVSGKPFADYVERHILAPLGMAHSTFAQPLRAALARDMSKGYRSATEPPKPFELLAQSPEGALSATAMDMAQFMLAHLQDGRTATGQILRPETTRRMHSPSIALPSGFDTMAHGWFRGQRNGRTVLEHGGDTILFHSDLQLLPEERVGLFVSFNSRGQGDAVYGIRERLMAGFMDRYFPAPKDAEPRTIVSARADAARIAGRYETSRRVQSGFMSLFYVLQGQDVVSANPDATISLSSTPGKVFHEIARQTWKEVGGERLLRLITLDGVRTIVDGHNPAGVLQAVPLRRNAGLNLPIFTLALLVLIVAALAWPIAEISRRFWSQPPRLVGRPLMVRRATRILVVADLIFLGGWFTILKPILSSDVAFYSAALDPMIRLLQVAALIPIAGAALGMWNAWLSLHSSRGWPIKAGSLLIALALIGVCWIAFVGGLISFTLDY